MSTVNLPASVEFIDVGAFSSCAVLNTIFVDENNQKYSSDSNGVLYNKEKTSLIQFPAGSVCIDFVVPDSVVCIMRHAFYRCEKLINITMPKYLKKICDDAFSGCKKLVEVKIPANTKEIGVGAFYGCTSLESLYIPEVTRFVDIISNSPKLTIYGCVGSYAEDYAEWENISFVAVEKCSHEFGEWSVSKENTCTENGNKYHICSKCYYIGNDIIVAPGHSWERKSRVEGAFVYKCEVCHAEEERPFEFVRGDVSGDAGTNVRDAAMILQYLAGWNVEINEDAADVNGDGTVNVRDAALILQFLAGWNVTLG